MKSKCSICANEHYLYGLTGRCDGCENDSLFEPAKKSREKKAQKTNYDKLRNLGMKELAAWIADHPLVSKYDENNPKHKAWLEWLRQEAKENA